MKKLFSVMLFFVFLSSCSPDDGITVAPDTDTYHFLHQWKRDTLISVHPITSYRDSMITYSSGDTTIVNYHGTTLYVFYKERPYYDNSDSTTGYIGAYIGTTPLDTSGLWSTCDVISPKFWSKSHSRWETGEISITINQMTPNFDDNANYGYYGFLN